MLALRAFQALGSVKRLETIVLLWRYINKIELNLIELCVVIVVCVCGDSGVCACVCILCASQCAYIHV